MQLSNEYRYKLAKGSKKHYCPQCEKKRLVRYVDSSTGSYLPEQYGRCDRETSCTYHVNPYKDGYAKMIRDKEQGYSTTNWQQQRDYKRPKPIEKSKPIYYPNELFEKTLKAYEQNTFIQNLLGKVAFPFEIEDVETVIALYYLGTVSKGYCIGATTFPFIDRKQNVRAIQVKQFDEGNHTQKTNFLHAILSKHYKRKAQPLPKWLEAYEKQDKKVSCLFGEHLLDQYPSNPIALVEAPKTAIYGTLYFGLPEKPENFLWLGVYNLSSLNYEKCKVLDKRDVYLFPDLSKTGKAFELWSNKVEEFERLIPSARFTVSDFLEQNADQAARQESLDLADFLIKQDWRKFRSVEHENERSDLQTEYPIGVKSEKSEGSKKTFFSQQEERSMVAPGTSMIEEQSKKPCWEIDELEEFFSTTILPKKPVIIEGVGTISDCSKFIQNHLLTLKANQGKQTYLPYLNRLQQLQRNLAVKH